MTIADDLVTLLSDHYGDVGGGAKPEYIINLARYKTDPPVPKSKEYIAVWIPPVESPKELINEFYADVDNILLVRIATGVSIERMEEIANEVRIVINSNAVTGVSLQYTGNETDLTMRYDNLFVWQFEAILENNAIPIDAAYDGWEYTPHLHDGDILELDGINSDGGAFPFDTTGPVTFNNNVVLGSNELELDAATLHGSGSDVHLHPGSGNTVANLHIHPLGTQDQACLHLRNSVGANYGSFVITIDGEIAAIHSEVSGGGTAPTTLNINDADWDTINIGDASARVNVKGYDVSAVLMLGPANAVWQPCTLEGWNPHDKGTVTNIGEVENVDSTNIFVTYLCPLVPLKGTLKLKVSGSKIHLNSANGTNYVTNTYVEGLRSNTGKDLIDQDITDKNAVQVWIDTFTAVDVSAASAVQVRLQTVLTNAAVLKINNVELQCYYDT